jgi:hypothetical protein
VGPLLLPFADGLSSRVSWRVFVRAVIADDGLHRAYGERGAFLTADGERDGAQNHAILPTIETVSIRAFAGRAEARSRPYHETLVSIARANGDAAYAISKASLNALTRKLASFVVILPVVPAAAR